MEIYFNRGANEPLMAALTKVKEQGMLLIELSDEKGHSNRELAAIIKYTSRASTLLKELENQGMAYHEIRQTTNVKTKGKEYDEHAYFIGPRNPINPQERLGVFNSIFQDYISNCEADLLEKFLKSRYINNLIKDVGFKPVFDIIKAKLHNESFRNSASSAILNLPAVIDEYKDQVKKLVEKRESISEFQLVPLLENYGTVNDDLFSILQNFDALHAIEFYRKIINDDYSKLYREVAPNNFITEAMKEFTDYDVYLSPFTSYPRNNPPDLLLQRPYERIYDDVYILSESDQEKFIKRAYVVYSHFAEILFEACIKDMRLIELDLIDYRITKMDEYLQVIDDVLPEESMEDLRRYESRKDYLKNIIDYIQITIKLAIYYWNIASLRFDIVIGHLNHDQTGKYHIHSDNASIWITDLQSGKRNPVASTDILSSVSLLPGPSDPFASLWPCNAFKEFDLDTKTVTSNEILEYMITNLRTLCGVS
jgi:hypothetical protein